MVAPGAPGMRPPTSMNPAMNMEAIARQGGRMPSGNWQGNPQGQPMMQQPPQGQPQAMGTPQQRSVEMPPPSAPAPGNGSGPRNQPASPQSGQAPPTPSQSNKPNPKGKKDKNEPKKVSFWETKGLLIELLTCVCSGRTRGLRMPTRPPHRMQILPLLPHLPHPLPPSTRHRSQRVPMLQLAETRPLRIRLQLPIHQHRNSNSLLLPTLPQVVELLVTFPLQTNHLISTLVDSRLAMSWTTSTLTVSCRILMTGADSHSTLP